MPRKRPHPLIDGLVKNAFQFVNLAIQEFERAPTVSVIHFYTAIELFVKARLAHEHWALIFVRADDADADSLQKGDFQSVGLKEAHQRILKITKESLPQPAFDAFNRLRLHRNKLVHFFPPSDLEVPGSPAQLTIVKEQCIAWHYLVELLARPWKGVFKAYAAEIDATQKLMRKHRAFLSARFSELSGEIKVRVEKGAAKYQCRSCKFESFLAHEMDGVRDGACLVCDHRAPVLTFQCDCGASVDLFAEGWGVCEKCDQEFTPKWLARHLNEDRSDPSDSNPRCPATCVECEFTEARTVVKFEGQYFCTCCFTRWRPEDLGYCEWCTEPCAGDLTNSHFEGCPLCDGYIGHAMSKDD